MTNNAVPYTIHGIKVMFPCKAYPTQLSMMDKIMKGLEQHQNCLLESPTGSGKSLALLCSCLAWQAAEYEKVAEAEKENKEKSNNEDCCNAKQTSPRVESPKTVPVVDLTSPDRKSPVPVLPDPVVTPKEQVCKTEKKDDEDDKDDDDDDDFKPAQKRFRTPANNQPVSRVKKNSSEGPGEENMECDPPKWNMELMSDTSPGGGACQDKDSKGPKEYAKVPQIFYGTRTHKQVSQMTRELSKTAYKHAKMCILSSREHSCIHPRVSQNKNKNDECKKLRDPSEGESCRYYHKEHVLGSQSSIKHFGLVQAWDIEDLVKLGKKLKACPYYGARELMMEADIVFCPYNYLIDPKIRKQMKINLKDQIVILDEAHNVEDSARDSASLTLNAIELQEGLDDLSKLVSMGIMSEQHRPLHIMIANILDWIHRSEGNMQGRNFEQACKIWTGKEIITELEQIGLTAGTVKLYLNHFQEAQDPEKTQDFVCTMTSRTTSILDGLFLVFGYLYGFERKFVCDYRVAILKTAVTVRDNVLAGGWKRAGGGTRKEWTYTLNFWCFNPSVVFSEVGADTRSIILTSGTLSPMTSFASELGVAFPIRLEANHVIANSQVWVGTLSSGPTGTAVNATFRNAETFAFQDEIGNMILQICQNIPHGVLCFFPSYGMMDKLSKRWQSTGLWRKLLQEKVVVSEPRSGGKSEFDNVMHEFYRAIRISEGTEEEEKDSDLESYEEDGPSTNGALFLAVCRGKVSEGLDFADNNARAVITVGIPFPSFKDIQVDLKRKYNNQYASQRGLLNGSEWYEIQAFRALNQALGRCIRHKKDWGAIVLVDERFNRSPKYTNSISKWVRHRIQHFTHFPSALHSMKSFAEARRMDPSPQQSPAALTQPQTPSTASMSSLPTPKGVEEGRNPTATPLAKGAVVKQENTPHGTYMSSSSTPASHNTAQHIQTPISSRTTPLCNGSVSVGETVNPNGYQPTQQSAQQVLFTPLRNAGINGAGSPLQFRLPAPSTTTPRPVTVLNAQNQGINNQQIRLLAPQSGVPQRVVLTQNGPGGATPQFLVLTSPQGAPVQVLKLAQQGNMQVGGHTTVNGTLNVQGRTLPIATGQARASGQPADVQPGNVNASAFRGVTAQKFPYTPDSHHGTATGTPTVPIQPTGQLTHTQTGQPGVVNAAINDSNAFQSLRSSQETVDREVSTLDTECSEVDREMSTLDTECSEVGRDLVTPKSSQQSLDTGRYQPGERLVCPRDNGAYDEDMSDSEMRDIDCPSTPPLFSASTSPAPSPSGTTVGSREQENSSVNCKQPCKTTVYGVTSNRNSQVPGRKGNIQGSTTTRSLFRKTPSKVDAAVSGQDKMNDPIVKCEAENNEIRGQNAEVNCEIDDNERSGMLVVKEEHTEDGTKDNKACAIKEELEERRESDHEKTATRSNLRRAVRNTRTSWKTRRLSLDEADGAALAGKEEKGSSLFCSRCNSLLLKGHVEQKTVENKDVASLHPERTNKKRAAKKRKRGPSDSQQMYIATQYEESGLCSLLPGQELKGMCSSLNAIYNPEESVVYVPQLCTACEASHIPLGVKMVTIKNKETEEDPQSEQVWLYCDAVIKKP